MTTYFISYSVPGAAQDSGLELVNTYAPPIDLVLLEDPNVRAWWRSISSDVQTIQAAFGQFADAELARAHALLEIDNSVVLTPAGKQQATAQAANKALQAIDAIDQRCQAAVRRLDVAVETARRGDAPKLSDVAANTRELQIQAAWRRVERLLKSASGLSETYVTVEGLAREACLARDEVTVAALEREIPAWYRFRKFGDDDASRALNRVEELRAATFDGPVARAAAMFERAAQDGWARYLQARNRVQGQCGIEEGRGNALEVSRILALPGWLQSDSLQLVYPGDRYGPRH